MWTLKPFGIYFWNSIVVSGVTALLSTALGALAGYGFSRFQFRCRTSLMAGFLATQMISGVLVIGPYFQILAAVELYNTLTGLIIAYVTICLPFAAWMSKGYFDSIPKELDEAGLVDGASRLQIFLRIIMPIACARDRFHPAVRLPAGLAGSALGPLSRSPSTRSGP